MKKKLLYLYIGGLLLAVVLFFAMVNIRMSLAQKDDAASPIPNGDGVKTAPVAIFGNFTIYSAKYVCGVPPVNPVPFSGGYGYPIGQLGTAVPATYMTAVNVHNPNFVPVTLYKKVSQAGVECGGEVCGSQISRFTKVLLQADQSLEIDCHDIDGLLGPILPPRNWSKGFVVLEVPPGEPAAQLDVVGVYTSMEGEDDLSLDVEPVMPKTVPLVIPPPPPPSNGTITLVKTSEVSQIPVTFNFITTGGNGLPSVINLTTSPPSGDASQTFTVAPGTYSITEQTPIPDGMYLSSRSCSPSGVQIPLGIAFTVPPGGAVTCTFQNLVQR